ncbi:polymeric immunoglobulin receptor-like isoform X1 [Arapaima gigas]
MARLIFLVLLFLLAGSPGALGVWTLNKVIGQKGASVTVPCHYDRKYKDHAKYWCRGYQWATCVVMARTKSTWSRGKVSIRDEPSQQIFTVTMSNLTERDTNKYWCAVEIGGITKPDVKASVLLTVTAGSAGLSVLDSMVAGVAGDNLTVRCLYSDRYAPSMRKWCRAGDWGSCVTAEGAKAAGVLINDNGTGVFAVTLRQLTEKDQGWYWCAAGHVQIPVHISVMVPTTAALPATANSTSQTAPYETTVFNVLAAPSADSAAPPTTTGGSSATSETESPRVSTPQSKRESLVGPSFPSKTEPSAASTLSSVESKTASTLLSMVASSVASTHPSVVASSVGSTLLTRIFTQTTSASTLFTKSSTRRAPSSLLTSAGLYRIGQEDSGIQKVHRNHVMQSLWIAGATLLMLTTGAIVIWKWRRDREVKPSCEMEEMFTILAGDVEEDSSQTEPAVVSHRLPSQKEQEC